MGSNIRNVSTCRPGPLRRQYYVQSLIYGRIRWFNAGLNGPCQALYALLQISYLHNSDGTQALTVFRFFAQPCYVYFSLCLVIFSNPSVCSYGQTSPVRSICRAFVPTFKPSGVYLAYINSRIGGTRSLSFAGCSTSALSQTLLSYSLSNLWPSWLRLTLAQCDLLVIRFTHLRSHLTSYLGYDTLGRWCRCMWRVYCSF